MNNWFEKQIQSMYSPNANQSSISAGLTIRDIQRVIEEVEGPKFIASLFVEKDKVWMINP